MSGGTIGGIVGGIVGAFIGMWAGPAGAAAGFAIGSTLGGIAGNLLDPPRVEAPEPKMQKVQLSEFGRPIPILYGTDRFAGTVIWQKYPFDVHEEESDSGKGGGGATVVSKTFSTSFAVLLCEGPIAGVLQVFADGRLVWDGVDTDTFSFTLYLGTEDQMPDPTMEGVIGVGQVPPHRGWAYVVFTDLMLKDFSERIPQLEFVVSTVDEVAIPITRIRENYDMDTDVSLPYINQWKLTSSEILVVDGYDTATTFGFLRIPITIPDNSEFLGPHGNYGTKIYNNDLTFAYERAVAEGVPIDFVLCNELTDPVAFGKGNEYAYAAVGNFKAAGPDSAGTPLWVLTGMAAMYPAIGISSLVHPGTNGVLRQFPMLTTIGTYSYRPPGFPVSNFPVGIEVAANLGVPTGEFIGAASLSEDQTKLYLFTAPSDGAAMDKWYEIDDSQSIARQGAITPTIAQASIGFGGTSTYNGGNANSFENNGRYMWLYQPSATISGETGGLVRIYEINPSTLVFAEQTAFGVGDVGGPLAGDGTTGGIKVLQTGYAGVVRKDGRLAIFRRVQPGEGVRLGDILSDLSSRTPLEIGEYNTDDQDQLVLGFRVTSQMEVANAIQALRQAYFVDATERDGAIVFVNRGGDSIVSIPSDDLAARPEGAEAPALLQITRKDEFQQPRKVVVKFVDIDFDYQQGTRDAERQVGDARAETTINLPLVLNGAYALQMAKALLWEGHEGRQLYQFFTSRKYLQYEPTDVINVDGVQIRVEGKRELANGVIEWTGPASRALMFLPDAEDLEGTGIGGGSSQPPQNPPTDVASTTLVLMDMALQSPGDFPFGFYAAVSPNSDGPWSGVAVQKSVDEGETWTTIHTTSTANVVGRVTEALSSISGSPTAILTVFLYDPGAELSSTTAAGLGNGANTFALQSGSQNWEIAQFRNATLTATDGIGRKTYQITVDVRGARGTSAYMSGHAAQDTFVLLPAINLDMPEAELNQEFMYRAVTYGQLPANAPTQLFTNTGEATDDYYEVVVTNLDTFVGACGSPFAGKKGLVPAPADGDCGAGKFLSAEGNWQVPSSTPGSGGSVTDGDKGDITVGGSPQTWLIDNDVVSNAKLANMATGTVKYRRTAGTGDPEDVAIATLANDMGLIGGATVIAQKVVVAGSPSMTTVTLTIPAGYTDLTIRIKARDAANQAGLNQYMLFNGDTTSGNYDTSQYSRVLNNSGSVSAVIPTAAGAFLGVGVGRLNNANAAAQYVIFINDYANTVFPKQFTCLNVARYNTTPSRDAIYVDGQWNSTAAITSVTFTAPSSYWVDGSTFVAYVS